LIETQAVRAVVAATMAAHAKRRDGIGSLLMGETLQHREVPVRSNGRGVS